jgi:hypothetical protein
MFSDKFVTVHKKCTKSHSQPQCTLQVVCEDRVLFVWVDLQFSLCGLQHPKCEWAIRHVYPPTSLFTQPREQKSKDLGLESTQLNVGNHSKLHTSSYKFFFHTHWTIISLPKILTCTPASPCIKPKYNARVCVRTHEHALPFHLK